LHKACNLLTLASVIPAANTFATSHSAGLIIWGVNAGWFTVENQL
jgi:hypothetical protein